MKTTSVDDFEDLLVNCPDGICGSSNPLRDMCRDILDELIGSRSEISRAKVKAAKDTLNDWDILGNEIFEHINNDMYSSVFF